MFRFDRNKQRLALVLLFIFVLLAILAFAPAKIHVQPLASDLQLTGHEVQTVTLEYATSLTSNFRSSAQAGAILGEYFSKDAVTGIMTQPGCIGIRIYYGKKSDGTPALVLAGVDANGADLANGVILETGFPCPPLCWGSSPLEH